MDEMNDNRRIEGAFFRGAAWLAISTLILKIIGLIYKIPLSYMLGDEGMGYFNSAYTVYVFFYVVGTAGIPKAISILVSKSKAENKNNTNDIFNVAFRFFTVSGLLLLTVFVIFGDTIAAAIGNEKSLYAMYAIAPSILFVCAAGVIRGYMSGQMKFYHIAVSELISGVLKLALGLVFASAGLRLGKSLPVIAAYTIFGITVGSFASFIYLLVSYTKIRERKRGSLRNAGILWSILKIAAPITLASAIGSVVNVLDLTFIMNGLEGQGYTESVANVLYGNYTTLAVPMLSALGTFITPVATAMLPVLAGAYAKDSMTEYNRQMRTSLTICTFICIPAAVYFAFYSYETLGLIFEESSAILGSPMLVLLAPAVFIIGPLTVINTALEAAGKPSIAFWSLTVGAFVKLAISFILISFGSVGILVAPIGTTASYLVSYVISLASISSIKGIKVPVLKTAIIPTLASFASALIARFCLNMFNNSGGVRLYCAWTFIIFSLSYLFFTLIFSKKTRNVLFKCVKIDKKRTNDL